MFMPKSVTLSTEKIKLVPLTMDHLEAFYQAGSFPELWTWVLPNQCISRAQCQAWITYSLDMVARGEHVVFVIFDKKSGDLVGSSRYCAITREDRNLEIGFSFITPAYQRSYVNTHAKYSLLTHAFEQLNAIRVQFKTHQENEKSRNAISRIGATFEGIMRNQRILPDGRFRHTALFSIIDSEWKNVKQHLYAKL